MVLIKILNLSNLIHPYKPFDGFCGLTYTYLEANLYFLKILPNLFLLINYHNIEPIKFDILTDYLTVFVDCHDAPLGRAAHSARHAAALSCHRRDCFHLRVGNEKMWELDMILRLKSCN
jgi:hypothetical protein